MSKDQFYEAMKVIAKEKGVKASPQHDLYKAVPPYFLNAFYYDLVDKKAKKATIRFTCAAKCPYFEELKLHIIDPDSQLKITDKVRANSVIRVNSIIGEDSMEFDWDKSDEIYAQYAARTFERIETWYKDFFSEVNASYGDLEGFFLAKREQYPMQALFVLLTRGDFEAAVDCLQLLPQKLNTTRIMVPQNDEQKQRLIDSDAQDWGSGSYLRDDMDCIIDYVAAKKNGLKWTAERAKYGLLKAERGE